MCAIARSHLEARVLDLPLGGAGRVFQAVPDFLGGVSVCDELQDLALTRGWIEAGSDG